MVPMSDTLSRCFNPGFIVKQCVASWAVEARVEAARVVEEMVVAMKAEATEEVVRAVWRGRRRRGRR